MLSSTTAAILIPISDNIKCYGLLSVSPLKVFLTKLEMEGQNNKPDLAHTIEIV